MADPHPTVVGIADIARRTGLDRKAIDMLRYRKVFPEPDWTVGDRPAWNWPKLEKWLKATGRL